MNTGSAADTATRERPAASAELLPVATRLGPVELTVSDLERAVAFYVEALGLRVHRDGRDLAASGAAGETGRRAALGAGGEDLLVLFENPAATRASRHAGLYHVALLYPSRAELARAAMRLAVTRTPVEGASDHGTHEAIYLADPDGNGLELAADRPREQWPEIGDPSLFAGGPQPLDLDGLLATVAEQPPTPRAEPGLQVGHVHLHVADTAAALRFYTEVVGFETVIDLGPAAAFVSAGGYHHHLAFNTWRGRGVGPAPANAVGLRHWTVYLPTGADVDAARARIERAGIAHEPRGAGLLTRDPDGNALSIAADSRAKDRPRDSARAFISADPAAAGPAGD
jgi:catechol 2,3-dioxygenase